MAKLPWKATHVSRNITRIDTNTTGRIGWEQWLLFRTDAHHDNPCCDQDLERKHLEQAKERNAIIIDGGDAFCAMQGKFDKRSNKSKLREEHKCGDYLDALVRTAADFYEPYAHNFAVLSLGNHETAIYKRHETCLTTRLAERLSDRTGARLRAGGYTNWIKLRFHRGEQIVAFTIWQIHGYGGGGPVTKDMIQGNRILQYTDADIVMFGHTHDHWANTIMRNSLTVHDKVERRSILLLKGGTYKDAYDEGIGGFEIEKGMPPKPLKQWWLRFYWSGKPHNTIFYEPIEAK